MASCFPAYRQVSCPETALWLPPSWTAAGDRLLFCSGGEFVYSICCDARLAKAAEENKDCCCQLRLGGWQWAAWQWLYNKRSKIKLSTINLPPLIVYMLVSVNMNLSSFTEKETFKAHDVLLPPASIYCTVLYNISDYVAYFSLYILLPLPLSAFFLRTFSVSLSFYLITALFSFNSFFHSLLLFCMWNHMTWVSSLCSVWVGLLLSCCWICYRKWIMLVNKQFWVIMFQTILYKLRLCLVLFITAVFVYAF